MACPRFTAAAGAALLLLAGCSGGTEGTPAPAPRDRVVSDALADPIMSDPDLTAQNDGDGALLFGAPEPPALPRPERGDRAAGAAREAAARLLGAGVPPLPDPVREDLARLRRAVTPAQVAAAAGVPGSCAAGLRSTARFAAELPSGLEIYPHGAVIAAAGADGPECVLRMVRYQTPAAVEDVAAFAHARLRLAGYGASHAADGDERVLRGRKGGHTGLVYLRAGPDGLTTADILVRHDGGGRRGSTIP